VLEEGTTTCCYAKSEKSWITDCGGAGPCSYSPPRCSLSASICCNAAFATETFIGAAARTGAPICLAVLASLPVWLGGEICAHDCDLCSRRAIERDPQPHAYMDQALTPVAEDEEDTLDLPTKTTAGRGLGRACEKPRCVATSSPSRS
jgi:hypothetical protein